MTGAPLPADEYARLLDLASYDILDTPREAAFDRIARLTARVLATPIALINFVDEDRLWSKASVGLDGVVAPRDDSFCSWTILQSGPLTIEDVRADLRFAHTPLVVGEPHVQMYAGTPLTTPAGQHIGTLCVMDDRPRALSAPDLQALQDLADLVVSELELRARNLALDRELDAQAQRGADLQRMVDQAQVLEAVAQLMDQELSPEEMILAASALLGEALAADYTGLIAFEGENLSVRAAYHHPRMTPEARAVADRLSVLPRALTWRLRDITTSVYIEDYPDQVGALAEVVDAGIQQVAWVPLGQCVEGSALLLVVRLQGSEVCGWRGSDRALLESAGRSVRSALRRQGEMQLAWQAARQDALTGVLNRRALSEDLTQWQATGRPFVLAGLDLDGLKAVNDQEGHARGDQLLQVFAATLKVELGGAGKVYRVGGDEFVTLGTGDEEQVLEAVDTAVLTARQVAPLRGASVGVAHSREASGDALLALADERMYAVKRRRHAARLTEAVC
ncbi:sensor domain-containing diguanylate cyclase [Deinococcus aerophilus]|uniref:Diguanylate cyclase n=1 Tax=Deinococcus aerophilus TaxID=522488 RepID=A0ABQ2GKG1_9DEIO|nr:sensor domain-containing diguanylate cyclase [Deinococcus aerophilus]GGL99354.1 diguanylate cyclase [Deinococcus aerophilus]